MTKSAMAKRLAQLLKELEQFDPAWKDDEEPDLGRKEVARAFERFKLDPQKPRHQQWLLFFLAHAVFGRRKAGRPKTKPTTI
jgi:hypothetical protein